MNQMGIVIYENLKGFMLPRRSSIFDMFNQKTVYSSQQVQTKNIMINMEEEQTLLKTAETLLH